MSKPRYFTTSVDCKKRISYSISKETTIEFEDVPAVGYKDEDGMDEVEYDNPNFTQKEWMEHYEWQHYTITGLLDELVKLAKWKLEYLSMGSNEIKKLHNIIEDAQCWEIDEEYIDDI